MENKSQPKQFITQYFNQSYDKSDSENSEESTKIEIYTDGACINNGKKNACSSFAFTIYFNDNLIYKSSKKIEESKQTNQRAELYSIYYALEYLKMNYDSLIRNQNNVIILYSDSEYSIKCITEWSKNWNQNDWKEKKNTDIIKNILNILPNFYVFFKHVKSHQTDGNIHSQRNNYVDQLARNAIQINI
jgi:ribonuclease HI